MTSTQKVLLAGAVVAACACRSANVPMEMIDWPSPVADAGVGSHGSVEVDAAPVFDSPVELAAPEPGSGVALRWSMSVSGPLMIIDYTVFNETDRPIAVADAMMAGHLRPDDAIISGDIDPNVIVFSRADLKPEANVLLYHPPSQPHYREVAAGATLPGTIKVALPIVAWRNYGLAFAITGHRTKAVLEVGFATFAPEFVVAGKVHAPLIVRGNVQPLPPGARLASPEEQVQLSHAVELPAGHSAGSASR